MTKTNGRAMETNYQDAIDEYDAAHRQMKFLIKAMRSSRKYGIPLVTSSVAGNPDHEERVFFIARFLLSLVRTDIEYELTIDENFKSNFIEGSSNLKRDAESIYEFALENTKELANG